MPPEEVMSLLEHINGIEPSINFVVETEDSNIKLPFLDVLLKRNDRSAPVFSENQVTLTAI